MSSFHYYLKIYRGTGIKIKKIVFISLIFLPPFFLVYQFTTFPIGYKNYEYKIESVRKFTNSSSGTFIAQIATDGLEIWKDKNFSPMNEIFSNSYLLNFLKIEPEILQKQYCISKIEKNVINEVDLILNAKIINTGKSVSTGAIISEKYCFPISLSEATSFKIESLGIGFEEDAAIKSAIDNNGILSNSIEVLFSYQDKYPYLIILLYISIFPLWWGLIFQIEKIIETTKRILKLK